MRSKNFTDRCTLHLSSHVRCRSFTYVKASSKSHYTGTNVINAAANIQTYVSDNAALLTLLSDHINCINKKSRIVTTNYTH
jgi:hypothetical protein